MEVDKIIELIIRGRRYFILRLFYKPEWKEILHEGQAKSLQRFAYCNDTAELRAVFESGDNRILVNNELRNTEAILTYLIQ